jgi:glycosyltransferase involved in cell wall biosynthesis
VSIRHSLDAREYILANSPVTEVAVTVVSDGSTDRTVELARPFVVQIRLVVFDRNRGYGAAIKEGWQQSDADLLGFLDADGTCDPRFFADLCRTLEAQEADVVLGSRLNRGSKMPAVRRIGNRFYAALLTGFSGVPVRDAASGMRVVRRKSLPGLLPLPDGLNFTPAMTARALMRGGTRIVEIDMPYNERQGVSKLSVARMGSGS